MTHLKIMAALKIPKSSLKHANHLRKKVKKAIPSLAGFLGSKEHHGCQLILQKAVLKTNTRTNIELVGWKCIEDSTPNIAFLAPLIITHTFTWIYYSDVDSYKALDENIRRSSS